MKRIAACLAAIVAMALLSAACSQAAPAPTPAPAPTKAPAATPKAPEPTKAAAPAAPTRAPAAQPTAAPAKKVEFPEKGKTITLLVPMAPGGGTDIGARVVAPLLERELGTPVQVVNKAGAGSQVGCTEVATAKPDGYTLLFNSLPQTLGTYLDPERKAVYTRKSFESVAMIIDDALGVEVLTDSPYKTLKDFVDAAKAKPEQIKMGDAGIMSLTHMAALLFGKATGVKLNPVHFDSGGQTLTALLGGHVDAAFMMISVSQPQLKAGAVRMLGISDTQESEFAPGVPTFTSQGYNIVIGNNLHAAAPAGTPKEVVDILSRAFKKVSETAEFKEKLKGIGAKPKYMDAGQLASYWERLEADIRSIIGQ